MRFISKSEAAQPHTSKTKDKNHVIIYLTEAESSKPNTHCRQSANQEWKETSSHR